jgi:hypothetical protein
MRTWLIGCALALFAVGCGGVEPTGQEQEEAKACPVLPIRCDAPCKQTGGGCPVQCHCPGYVACGPLKCGEGEVCCTGPGPVHLDPSLNHYSCNPHGYTCPL